MKKLTVLLAMLLIISVALTACAPNTGNVAENNEIVPEEEGFQEEDGGLEDEGALGDEGLTEEEGALDEDGLTEEEGLPGTGITDPNAVIGGQVVDTTGEQIGTVQDVTTDAAGRQWVVVSTDQGLTPVPADQFQVNEEQNQLTFNGAATDLATAPTFQSEDEIAFGDPAFEEQLSGFWGQ